MTEVTEVELNATQCAEVALHMYREWQEAMKPPLFAYRDFPVWLEMIISNAAKSAGSE